MPSVPLYAAPFLHLASVSRETPAHDKPERLGGWIYRALGLPRACRYLAKSSTESSEPESLPTADTLAVTALLRERVTSRLPASLSVTSTSARLKSRLVLVKRASSNFSQRRIRGLERFESQFSATLAFRARSYSRKSTRYWNEEASTRNRIAIDQCPPLVET